MVKILHLNAGNETGGGMYHILRMLGKFKEANSVPCVLGVMEKKELYDRAKAANIETVYFENGTRLSMPLLRKIEQYIKTENITHVHTHGPRANVYMNMLKKKVKIPWVVTVHSDPFFDFKDKGIYGKFLTRLHLQAIKNADRIISVCHAFYPPLVNAGINIDNMKTVHNGIDFLNEMSTEFVPESQNFREQLGFTKEDFLFLKVARLESVKGHGFAIRAFAELMKNESENIHLLLLGDGSLKNKLMELVEQLDLKDHVHFLGERKDIDRFYKIANVTLLTSLSESFPYVLLESARAKTPVISTNVGDVGHLIYQDELGWKVATSDMDGLVEAMREAVCLHADGLRQMGQRLYSYASSNFSLDKCAHEVYNVYKRI
ncbi:glycosyltransferase family 4 protein [Pseudogracilibacillus sp. SO30301A]|uniref:glycosyltransferase family 4 protein n=1 Tax=Pseudogracilibacillus sp. SO30301A TaxID=3098291 RepID=UPI00300E6C84